jgi:hypothetical protein
MYLSCNLKLSLNIIEVFAISLYSGVRSILEALKTFTY